MGGGGGAYGLHFAPPLLGLSLNMSTLSTNINVMHDLKVIHTLLATCSLLIRRWMALYEILLYGMRYITMYALGN